MSELRLTYRAPGPVAAAFMANTARVKGIMGPIGSGKTSAALMNMITLAQAQQPSFRDGVRRTRWCVVRDTYRQLWKTTIKSWFDWVPKDLGSWTGADNAPCVHTIRFQLPDGTMVDMEVHFIAIGENSVEDVLRGYEPTGFYLNEADLLAEDVLSYARGRAGRYPKMNEGGPTWYGCLLDFNAPDTDSWIYRDFVETQVEEYAFFRQPSGLATDAENIQNLPPGYYENQMRGQPEWYIRRMIRNEFGFSRDGKPIYPEFNDLLHVSPAPLAPYPGLKLLIGLDAGGSPAGAIGQRHANGQLRILEELISEHGTGPTRFGAEINKALKDRYPTFGLDQISCTVDPSAFYGGDGDDKAWTDIVRAKTGLRLTPAPTNNPTPRWDAVRLPLTTMIDGHHPGLLLDPRCRVLRKGFNSHYRFKRKNVPGATVYDDKADKNDYSHPHDALQYLALATDSYSDVMGRKRQGQSHQRRTHAIMEEGGLPWDGRAQRAVL